MEIWHALVFGVVEGITEFLPISSTGHLMLTRELLGIPTTTFVKSFEIAIQLGAICAVLALYPRRFLSDKKTILRIGAAFLPTVILGALAYPVIKSVFQEHVGIVLASLFVGGIVLIVFERWVPKRFTSTIEELSIAKAATIGALQAIAFIPGVSRSGTTIVSGMFLGLEKKAAVEFSFLLAVPTMLAATGYDILKQYQAFTASDVLPLVVGFVSSFLVAILAIKFLVNFVSSHSFASFGVYRIIISIALFLVLFV